MSETAQHTNSILNALQTPIFILDNNWNIIFCNGIASEIFFADGIKSNFIKSGLDSQEIHLFNESIGREKNSKQYIDYLWLKRDNKYVPFKSHFSVIEEQNIVIELELGHQLKPNERLIHIKTGTTFAENDFTVGWSGTLTQWLSEIHPEDREKTKTKYTEAFESNCEQAQFNYRTRYMGNGWKLAGEELSKAGICTYSSISLGTSSTDYGFNGVNWSEIFDHLPIGILIIDRTKHIRYANVGALQLLEQNLDLIGKICHNTICDSNEEECPLYFTKYFSNSVSQSFTTEEGRELYVTRKTAPIQFDGQEMMLEAFIDISDRIEAEQKVASEQKRIEALMSGHKFMAKLATMMQGYSDRGQKFPEMLKLLGRYFKLDKLTLSYKNIVTDGGTEFYSWHSKREPGFYINLHDQEELHTSKLFVYNAGDRVPSFLNGSELQLSELSLIAIPLFTKMSFSGMLQIEKKGKGNKWTENEIMFFYSVQTIFENTFELLQSHSKLIEAKEMADIANIAKSEFLANISHEIRTPLNAMLGYSQIILGKNIDSESDYALNSIIHSGGALLELLTDIIELSKIESGIIEYNLHYFSIDSFFRKLERLFIATAETKKLSFSIEYDRNIPQNLLLDEHMLKQILVNLIGNAFKFTKAGSIFVSAWYEESTNNSGDLYIQIKDTGIGITEKSLEKIFEPFFQNEDINTKSFSGVGIGLTIVKKLLHKLNGDISVTSQEGEGTSFTVHIPQVTGTDKALHVDNLNDEIQNYKNSAPEILVISEKKEVFSLLDQFFDSNRYIKQSLNKIDPAHITDLNSDMVIIDTQHESAKEVFDHFSELGTNESGNIPVLISISNEPSKQAFIKGQLPLTLTKTVAFKEFIRLMPEVIEYKQCKEQKAFKSNYCLEGIEHPDQLSSELKKTTGSLIQSLGEGIILNDADELAACLYRLGKKYKAQCCVNLGKQLAKAVKAFDLFKIDELLKEIDNLQQDLTKS